MKYLRSVLVSFCIITLFGCEEEETPKSEGPLPEIVTLQADNITGNTFTISGQVINDHGVSILEKGFIWNKPGLLDRQFHEGHIISTETSDLYNSSIVGLLPLTQYIACAFATNQNGTAYGNIVDFYTSDRIWSEKGSFTDSRDGEEYDWVKIGDQVWMAENLRYMPFVCDSNSYGIWVYGKYTTNIDSARNDANYQIYGCLYDYATASSIAPEGWHLPSETDWQELIIFLGGEDQAGRLLKSSDSRFWYYTEVNNAAGFNALPSGSFGPGFNLAGNAGYFWSSTEYIESLAVVFYLNYGSERIYPRVQYINNGYSVRCIKD